MQFSPLEYGRGGRLSYRRVNPPGTRSRLFSGYRLYPQTHHASPRPIWLGPDYCRRKDKAICGRWLACASTDTPARSSIWFRVSSAVSTGTFASRIWDRTADGFSEATCKLLIVDVKRFWIAPTPLRILLSYSSAKSMVSTALFEPAEVRIDNIEPLVGRRKSQQPQIFPSVGTRHGERPVNFR